MSVARHRWWKPYPGDTLPYSLERLRWIRRTIGQVPRPARVRWLWSALTYETEICFDCGRPVMPHTDSWWSADDALWLEVVGGPGGVLCPPCFTGRCRERGINIYWRPVVDSRTCEARS